MKIENVSEQNNKNRMKVIVKEISDRWFKNKNEG